MRELESAITLLSREIESREKAWSWRRSYAAQAMRLAAEAAEPAGAVLRIRCDSKQEFANTRESGLLLKPGVAGQACAPADANAKPMTARRTVPLSKRSPLTFSLWVQPEAADTDVALLSTINYATNRAATTYGKGIELRLVGGELEFRYADRLPAYSIRVRTQGARLAPGQWRHLTLVYGGAAGKDDNRAYASRVRVFCDAQELEVQILNDDLGVPDRKRNMPRTSAKAKAKAKPELVRFRVGWDNAPGAARLAGGLDEIAVWPRALTRPEIVRIFDKQALPYAVTMQRKGQATSLETGWLRAALLNRSDPVLAQKQRELKNLRSELLALERNAPTVMVMQDLEKPRETHVLIRGSYNAPGEKVEPGVPEQLLGAWPAGAPKNRLGLAQWLTKPDHPLTGRVVVNRFWQQVFGQGLVKTSENFGLQGEWPSHPDLLDWLAREFIDSGWNVKALMRQIVLSATYRQDSAASKELIARDPENRLLARGPRFRLPAELIRDQALKISGLLKNRLGGPSVYPYQPKDLYKGLVVAADYPGTKYVQSTGDDLYRRSLYTFWKRTVPHPTMIVFDAPDREFCVVRRSVTNTPLQALTLLNDPIFVEAARKLAERSILEGGAAAEARLSFAFRLATGRQPDDHELGILSKTLSAMLNAYRADKNGAEAFVAAGSSRRDPSIPVSELAAYTAVANMILNMDEVITKG